MEVGENLYRIIINSLDEGVFYINSKDMITLWNTGMTNITGYGQTEINNKNIYDDDFILYSGSIQSVKKISGILKYKEIKSTLEAEGFLVKKNGYIIPVISKRIPIFENSIYKGSIIIVKDITRLRIDENKKKELARLAFQDDTTGINSRHYGEIVLSNSIEETNKHNKLNGLVYMLVSDLKEINRKNGHTFGDELLKFVGKYLFERSDEKHFICRWEGSKFLIILKDFNENMLNLYCNKLKEELSSKIRGSSYSKADIKLFFSNTAIKPKDSVDKIILRLEDGFSKT